MILGNSQNRIQSRVLLTCILYRLSILWFDVSVVMQVRGEIEGVSAGTVFDMLLDGDYRKMWDENVIEDYELCALDSTNDIGYYSRKQ